MQGRSWRALCPPTIYVVAVLIFVLTSNHANVKADDFDNFCPYTGGEPEPVVLKKILKNSFTAEIYSIDLDKKEGIRGHEHWNNDEQISAIFLNSADNLENTEFHIYDRKTAKGVTNQGGTGCKEQNSEPTFGFMHWYLSIKWTIKYKGTEDVSGETLHLWRSRRSDSAFYYCDYLYVTGKATDMNNPTGKDYVPVKMIFKKMDRSSKKVSQINHHVLSFEARDAKSDDFKSDLSVPIGYTCDLTTTVDIPNLPSSIYYTAEYSDAPQYPTTYLLDSQRQLIISHNVWTYMLDSYKLGALFEIEQNYEGFDECDISRYAVLDHGDTDVSLTYGDSYLKQPFESVQHFIGVSEGFTYNGEHEVRGIPCDVYSKFYDDFRGKGQMTVILYFSKPNLNIYSSVGGKTTSGSVLLKKELWKDGAHRYEQNIFNLGRLDYSRLNYDPLDISLCSNQMGKVEFTLLFEVKGQEAVTTTYEDRKALRIALKSEVAKTAGVDELRVHVMDLLSLSSRLMAKVRLLGEPVKDSYIRDVRGSIRSSATGEVIFTAYNGYENCRQKALDHGGEVFGSFCTETYQCIVYRNVDLRDFFIQDGCKGFIIGKNRYDPVPLPDAMDKVTQAVEGGTLQVEDYTASKVSIFDPATLDNVELPNIQKYEKIPGARIKKDIKTQMQMSLGQCADSCTASLGYQCETFTFCGNVRLCRLNPSVDRDQDITIEPDDNCDVYMRKYVSEFTAIEATSTAIDTEMIFEMVNEPNMCARFCLDLNDFRCESFDFCSLDEQGASGTCSLFRKHYFDLAASSEPLVLPNTKCTHYARNYIGDYDRKEGLTSLPIQTKIRKSSVESCARSCSTKDTSGEGHCTMFQFCAVGSVCEFIDESSITGDAARRQPKLKEASGCATYSLKKNIYQIHGRSEALRAKAVQAVASTLNGGLVRGKYGPGSMAALALIMLVVGAGLLVLGLFVLARYRRSGGFNGNWFSRGGKGQEMSMQFTKAQFDE